jgi:hypothetical protein
VGRPATPPVADIVTQVVEQTDRRRWLGGWIVRELAGPSDRFTADGAERQPVIGRGPQRGLIGLGGVLAVEGLL